MKINISEFGLKTRQLPETEIKRVQNWIKATEAEPKDINHMMALAYADFLLLTRQPLSCMEKFLNEFSSTLDTVSGKFSGMPSLMEALQTTAEENRQLKEQLHQQALTLTVRDGQLVQRDEIISKLQAEASETGRELDKLALATNEWKTNLETVQAVNQAMTPCTLGLYGVLDTWCKKHADIPENLMTDIKMLFDFEIGKFRETCTDCQNQRLTTGEEIQAGIKTIRNNPDFKKALESSPLLLNAFQLLERQIADMVVP